MFCILVLTRKCLVLTETVIFNICCIVSYNNLISFLVIQIFQGLVSEEKPFSYCQTNQTN